MWLRNSRPRGGASSGQHTSKKPAIPFRRAGFVSPVRAGDQQAKRQSPRATQRWTCRTGKCAHPARCSRSRCGTSGRRAFSSRMSGRTSAWSFSLSCSCAGRYRSDVSIATKMLHCGDDSLQARFATFAWPRQLTAETFDQDTIDREGHGGTGRKVWLRPDKTKDPRAGRRMSTGEVERRPVSRKCRAAAARESPVRLVRRIGKTIPGCGVGTDSQRFVCRGLKDLVSFSPS